MTSVTPGFRFAGLVEQRSTSTPGWLAAREGCETMTHGWASGQPGGLPTVNLKWFHGSKGASPLMASAAKAAATFSHSGSSGSCFTSGSSITMCSLDGRARLTIQVSSSICWTVTGERAGSSGGHHQAAAVVNQSGIHGGSFPQLCAVFKPGGGSKSIQGAS